MPVGFTNGSARDKANEMTNGEFFSKATAAVSAFGSGVKIEPVELAAEAVTGVWDDDSSASSTEVMLFLILATTA